MENFRQMEAMIQKLQNFEFQKIGQLLCEKVPFRKSGHKIMLSLFGCMHLYVFVTINLHY